MIMIAVAMLLSLVLCLLLGVPYIDFLRKRTIGQYILDVAPEDLSIKAKTKEQMDAVGQKLAIEANAVVLLQKRMKKMY